MSIDFGLEAKQKLTAAKLKSSLGDKYLIEDSREDPSGELTSFTLALKESPNFPLEFSKQENGNYWFYTYDYDDQSMERFTKTAADVARKLDCTIYDNQDDTSGIKPEEFINRKELKDWVESQNMMSRLPIEDMIKHPEKYEGKNAFEVQQEDKNRKKQ